MGKDVLINCCKLFLIVTVIVGFTVEANSQERHLSKKITLSVTSMPLEDALSTISRAGNFTFSYNADLIDADRRVSVRANNRNVDAVLTDLLGEHVRKKEVGDHVILVSNPPRTGKPKERTECTVTGVVSDAFTGIALQDVTVYEIGGRRSSLTRAGGNFSMAFPDGENLRSLSICKSGYRDTVVFIRPLKERSLIISLTPRTVPIEKIPVRPGTVELASVKPGSLALDSLRVVSTFVPRKLRINSINLHIINTWPVQVSFVPYLSTNWRVSGSVNNAFSLNLLAGYSGGVRGFELGGLLNIDRNTVRGFQLGGLGNIVGKNTTGLQVGGLFNVDLGKVYGCQVAGLVNSVSDTLRGAQIAGLLNYIPTRWKGAQIAGLANISMDHVTGLQLAGLLNVAKEENRGVQVAGLLNYTKVLKGVQIGVFNVSNRVESGIPVGFFSYVHKGGYLHAELSADEVFYANIAFKTGTRRFYNIFKVGTNDSLLLNFAYGVGTLFPIGKKFAFTIDFTGGLFFGTRQTFSWYGSQLKLVPAFEYQIARHFFVFLGPALNFCFYSDAGEQAYPKGLPFYNFYDRYHSGTREQMWIGGVIGFRI